MKFYSLHFEEVIKKLDSSEDGLTEKEAEKRLTENGKNKLQDSKKESKLTKILNEFKDLMIIILILSAVVSFILSIINNEPFTDSIIILAIVILNAVMGFVQELKADKALDALKKMQVTKVKVKREDKISIINSEDVVKGDIISLEAGDTVPADARIIWEASLKVDESSLTGESIAVEKSTVKLDEDTPLPSRVNMVYSGTQVVYGKCLAVVCKTGMDTEFGLIASSLNKEEKEITPLQRKINGISKFLSIVILIIILIMFIIGLAKGMDFMEVLILSISLAVAAIPEGLPAVITITLSIGMSAMAKRKAIVRRMSSVETLGCTEVICSDKTGTITQNKMKVREIFFNNEIKNTNKLDKNSILSLAMVLNNDVEKNKEDYIGDPTEIALYEAIEEITDVDKIRKENKRIDELPFDSDRKMMSTVHKNNKITVYTKGSFDSIIKRCTHILEDNKIIELTEEKKNELKQVEIEESDKAYRILAFAYKELNKDYNIDDKIEENLVFLGMTALIDPPREDVKEAIECCKSAHIKPIMITGDSLSTAKAIAKEIGILEKDDEAITGDDLDKLSEEELVEAVNNYSVYARVSPMNKLSIVNAWKQNNKVVAMTGDGVNDAPALKTSNIGVGMGITGTEVSKSVSDIVLVDDSFSTIVTAVREGRRIFDNIRNVLVYLLTGNIAEILIVFIGMLFGIEVFLPIQLLYINLVTDGIPAIALAFEEEEKNIMSRNIRKKDSSFFTPFLLVKMLSSAILKTIAVLMIYYLNLKLYNQEVARTISFLTLIIIEMLFAYSCRNLKESILNKDIFANKQLNKCTLLLIVIQILIFVTPLRNLFNIVSLNILQVTYSILISVGVIVIIETIKYIITQTFKD